MAFKAVGVYDLDGTFLGYGIKKDGANKLHTANLWTESPEDVADLQAQLSRLSDDRNVRDFWPDVRDPAVQALLNDPTWQPLKLTPIEVVDEENSLFIWEEEPRPEDGFPGRMDEDLSQIVHKWVDAPAPSDVQLRVKNACEVIARQRAEAAA